MSKIAYNYLVKLLSFRDYSEHKLREKLREKKFSPEESESAICELKSRGYLREDLYVEARIKGFMNKHCSANYIKQKLQQEKVEVDINRIYEIFDEYRIDECDQIKTLIAKKLKSSFMAEELTPEDKFKLSQKALRYAMTKGHKPGDVLKILKSMKNADALE